MQVLSEKCMSLHCWVSIRMEAIERVAIEFKAIDRASEKLKKKLDINLKDSQEAYDVCDLLRAQRAYLHFRILLPIMHEYEKLEVEGAGYNPLKLQGPFFSRLDPLVDVTSAISVKHEEQQFTEFSATDFFDASVPQEIRDLDDAERFGSTRIFLTSENSIQKIRKAFYTPSFEGGYEVAVDSEEDMFKKFNYNDLVLAPARQPDEFCPTPYPVWFVVAAAGAVSGYAGPIKKNGGSVEEGFNGIRHLGAAEVIREFERYFIRYLQLGDYYSEESDRLKNIAKKRIVNTVLFLIVT